MPVWPLPGDQGVRVHTEVPPGGTEVAAATIASLTSGP